MTQRPRQQRDPSWWVLGPAALISVGILIIALCLRTLGVRIGRALPPTSGGGASSPPREATPSPPAVPSIWLAPRLPAQVALPVAQWVAEHPHAGGLSDSASEADISMDTRETPGATLVWERIYVVAVPYLHPLMNLGSAALQERWQAPSRPQDSALWLVDPDALEALTALLGPQGPGAQVELVPAQELPQRAWAAKEALAFLPFDQLVPRLRPLRIDGHSVLDPQADLSHYPLALRAWAQGPEGLLSPLIEAVQRETPKTNRDLNRLGTLATTGVTALTRMVAWQMDETGDPGYPAREIGPLLSSADVTHISHEVPFAADCAPQKVMSSFCARPTYMETLRLLGADVVELTGNHLLDFGPEAMLASLDLYQQEGIRVFGGGRRAEEARRPLIVKVKGTRVAFLGYNQAGPPQVWSGDDSPGAARFDLEQAREEIALARTQADVVIVHVQHAEAYSVHPGPRQRLDFLALAEAGADIVVGTQAHQPQTIEFHERSLILHGLGNLIFDQLWSLPTRQSLVAWHVLYDGRHLATELLPTQMGHDLLPRWLQGAEAQAVIEEVMTASQ
ncbi:MAG: CapA family protein [Anaerolineae bacterium]